MAEAKTYTARITIAPLEGPDPEADPVMPADEAVAADLVTQLQDREFELEGCTLLIDHVDVDPVGT